MWRSGILLSEVCWMDVGEGVGKFWYCFHLVLSLSECSLFAFIVMGWVLEDRNACAMEIGACHCCCRVVVYVVHDRCGEHPFKQNRRAHHPIYCVLVDSCISQLRDFEHSVV